MSMGYPDLAAEAEIVLSRHGGPPPVLDPVLSLATRSSAWSRSARRCASTPSWCSTRWPGAGHPSSSDVRLGASPRGSLGLLRAAQSLAAAEGRSYAIADDVKRLAVPVLAHRLLVAPDAQLRGVSAERVVTDLLGERQRAGRRRRPDGQAQRGAWPARSSGSRGPAAASSPGRWSSLALGIVLGLSPLVGLGAAGLAASSWRVVLVHEPLSIDVARAQPREVERALRPRFVTLTFRRRGRRARAFTAIETVAGARRTAGVGPAIAAGHVERLTYELDTSRRGNVTAGPLVLRRTDPFGLVTAERRVTGTVHGRRPAPSATPLRMLPSGRLRDLEGPTREVSKGTASFHQLREYVPGDDMRHIHWRTTARTGTMMVKQLVDTTRPEIVVIVDNRRRGGRCRRLRGGRRHRRRRGRGRRGRRLPAPWCSPTAPPTSTSTGCRSRLDRLTAVALGDADSLSDSPRCSSPAVAACVFVTGEPSAADLLALGKLAHGFAPAYLVSVVARTRGAVVAAPRDDGHRVRRRRRVRRPVDVDAMSERSELMPARERQRVGQRRGRGRSPRGDERAERGGGGGRGGGEEEGGREEEEGGGAASRPLSTPSTRPAAVLAGSAGWRCGTPSSHGLVLGGTRSAAVSGSWPDGGRSAMGRGAAGAILALLTATGILIVGLAAVTGDSRRSRLIPSTYVTFLSIGLPAAGSTGW